MIFWPWMFFAGREKWKAVSDEERPVSEVFQDVELSSNFLGAGDAIIHPNGSLWIVTTAGTRRSACCVRGRIKTPTEMYQ